MYTRIRYRKQDHLLISNKFNINKHNFMIVIITDKLKYSILDNYVDLVIGSGKSLSELKKLAKQSLIDLGIEFKSESRLKKDNDNWEMTNLKDYP